MTYKRNKDGKPTDKEEHGGQLAAVVVVKCEISKLEGVNVPQTLIAHSPIWSSVNRAPPPSGATDLPMVGPTPDNVSDSHSGTLVMRLGSISTRFPAILFSSCVTLFCICREGHVRIRISSVDDVCRKKYTPRFAGSSLASASTLVPCPANSYG